MSAWRKEASKRLPELQRFIASREVDSPMMLWIELHMEFERLCMSGTFYILSNRIVPETTLS